MIIKSLIFRGEQMESKNQVPLHDRMEQSEKKGEKVRAQINGGDEILDQGEKQLQKPHQKNQDVKAGDTNESDAQSEQ